MRAPERERRAKLKLESGQSGEGRARDRVGHGSVAYGTLIEILAGRCPLEHEALDALEESQAIEHLRSSLVVHGALPPRDAPLFRFGCWLEKQTAKVSRSADRRPLKAWAHWHLANDLNYRRRSGKPTSRSVYYARTQVSQSIAFVEWLRGQHRSYPQGEERRLLDRVLAGYPRPPVIHPIHPFARRSVLMCCMIAATLACAIVAGCGTSQSRQTTPRKPGYERRLPVYAAGKLIGYCHGHFSGSGPSVSFHAEWRRGSREASLCAGGTSEGVYDALYKAAGSQGLNGARLLRLVRVHPDSAVKGRIVGVYTATAKPVGFCVPGEETGSLVKTGSLVCTGEGRQASVYNLRARLLGQCTPGELVSGRGNLVCTEEVPSNVPAL